VDDDFKNDVRSGYVYLAGFIEYDARGVPRRRFYKEGSKKSDQCRRALARVLRSENPLRKSLPRQLREMLADMFEPEEPGSIWGERKLTASNRANRRPRDHGANSHLTSFVWGRVKAGAGVDAAISEAIDKFGVSRERMYKLWAEFRPIYEKVWGPLQNQNKGRLTQKAKRGER
jgi:hypothetical protein